jgi:hypothetical protein
MSITRFHQATADARLVRNAEYHAQGAAEVALLVFLDGQSETLKGKLQLQCRKSPSIAFFIASSISRLISV